jgi:hypothetical protein
MIASPLIKEIVAENTQDHIPRLLTKRFGAVPEDVTKNLRAVNKERKLQELFDDAVDCPDLEAFRARLFS